MIQPITTKSPPALIWTQIRHDIQASHLQSWPYPPFSFLLSCCLLSNEGIGIFRMWGLMGTKGLSSPHQQMERKGYKSNNKSFCKKSLLFCRMNNLLANVPSHKKNPGITFFRKCEKGSGCTEMEGQDWTKLCRAAASNEFNLTQNEATNPPQNLES